MLDSVRWRVDLMVVQTNWLMAVIHGMSVHPSKWLANSVM